MTEISQLLARVDVLRPELIRVLSDLVRIPTLNTPPRGAEKMGQERLAAEFRKIGCEPDLYDIGQIRALHVHPLRHLMHDVEGRWNLAVRISGAGGGRSLILNGHMDTVPPSEFPWKRNPLQPAVEDGRLYGLGAYDMKASLTAMYLFARVLRESGARLRGDLILESVCDEEDAGVHGTIAQRLRGYHADAALALEPSALSIFNMHKGAYFPEVHLEEPAAGINLNKELIPQIPRMLGTFLMELDHLEKIRESGVKTPPEYQHQKKPTPVWICRIVSGLWGKSVPIVIASRVQIFVYLQTLPGEPLELVRNQFADWIAGLSRKHPDLFPKPPAYEFTLRQMDPSFVPSDHSLVTTLARAVETQTGARPKILGSPAPCDMFAFNNHFGIPCVWFGPDGGNAHAPDEYVELDSVVECVRCLIRFAGDWCGWA
ncbi:MAG: M20/M25/M40 family metallo-hydrolase [Verrucomicrobia bacterium]|nr:M20/M25/M40 family metallo-hydrolase [Verrucomicrobiota bacterium]